MEKDSTIIDGQFYTPEERQFICDFAEMNGVSFDCAETMIAKRFFAANRDSQEMKNPSEDARGENK